MKTKLIVYDLSKLDQYHKVLVNRILFGFKDNSNKGQYQYKRKGILDAIPHFRLPKGAMIVKIEDEFKIISVFKKSKAKYEIYDILVNQSMLKKNKAFKLE
jgi:hypothetical protein